MNWSENVRERDLYELVGEPYISMNWSGKLFKLGGECIQGIDGQTNDDQGKVPSNLF